MDRQDLGLEAPFSPQRTEVKANQPEATIKPSWPLCRIKSARVAEFVRKSALAARLDSEDIKDGWAEVELLKSHLSPYSHEISQVTESAKVALGRKPSYEDLLALAWCVESNCLSSGRPIREVAAFADSLGPVVSESDLELTG